MKKLLIMAVLLLPLIGFAQHRPLTNASTLQGLDTSDFVRTTAPNRVVGQGTNGQILVTDGAGGLTWTTSSSTSGVIGIDATNISAVKLYTPTDTMTESFAHVHTEYASVLAAVVDVTSATYTVPDHVNRIILNVEYTTTGAVTVTLPTVKRGITLTIKDADGNASANNITISGGTIDGAASKVLTNDYQSVNIYCDGTDWAIF